MRRCLGTSQETASLSDHLLEKGQSCERVQGHSAKARLEIAAAAAAGAGAGAAGSGAGVWPKR